MMTTTTENQHCVAGPCQVNLEALLREDGPHIALIFFVFQEPNLIGRADFLRAQPQIGFKTSSDKLACFAIHCCVMKHI